MDEEITWNIIDKYFNDNQYALVAHHIDSYNDFFKNGIKSIFKEKNPIRIMKDQNPETKEFKFRCNIYLGGKNGDKLFFGKPIIFDKDREHYMYPNEARIRNMNYSTAIEYEVDVEFIIRADDGELIERVITLPERIYLGKFPIMVNSELCILNGMSKELRFNLGECKNDPGGYFIIDGKEKVIVPQEKFADNMLYVRENKDDELYSHSAEIRSVSEDASKPMRTTAVKLVAPTPTKKNGHILVSIPNVRKAMPLFIVMRALGIESDKEIIQYCLLDLEKYSNYVDLFIPSIHDAGKIFNQELALKYIATFTKQKTVSSTLHILMDYFLPHIGELNFQSKAYFLGYMVKQMLEVYTKEKQPTDRDSFKFKRVEITGMLLYDLFKEYYTLQQQNIYLKIDKEFTFHKVSYHTVESFPNLIENNYKDLFKDRVVEEGFRKAFKGNWGSEEHTKRMGVVQPLNRLSFNSFITHLRKINLPMDSSAKVVKPRFLHGSQWGIIDALDSPDGGNIGFHKHLAIMAKVTSNCSGIPITKWFRNYTNMLYLEECTPKYLEQTTKLFVNGVWIGAINNPEEVVTLFKEFRRSALIPIYTSISWDIASNEIMVYTDSGRLCRPVFFIDKSTGRVSYDKPALLEVLKKGEFTWQQLISGFSKKNDETFNTENCKIYELPKNLYGTESLNQLHNTQAIIEFMDTSESETALISLTEDKLTEDSLYTHLEIHPSLILGTLSNMIIYPENNPLARNVFSCGQSRQAISVYHSNFHTRIDKMGVVLNYGEVPLVKSRYLKYITNDEMPYGENAIVAIGVYGGYNVEDSILFNEGAIKRGLFKMTYYTMYESREESSKVGKNEIDSKFANIEKSNVVGLKMGVDYSQLDEYGLIKENTPLDDKTVVIGKVLTNLDNPETVLDASEYPKKGQLGYVDKSFMTEGEEGFRIAKVRIREEREPNIGDKFASRAGQKGTVGLIIPERDMPFTSSGIKPDLIINPHAIPSRMTLGQLVETIVGKACAIYGGFGDCTAFVNKGTKNESFGKLLNQAGFNSYGNEILYNGQTGEQLETEIFMGPTYYMRLKHMVKDKVNYRGRGPRTVLTRQTVQGRANDGGLRIGEMERDGIIAHGASKFVEESMMLRGDEYYMAVCNQTGSVAVYNESRNLFLSPQADGPIKFTNVTQHNADIVNISRFGRDFSVVRVPYAFKLLMQELKTMNIDMKIITEDNVEQLTSMSYSDNYKKLSGQNKELRAIVNNTIEKVNKQNVEGTSRKYDEPKTESKSDELDEKAIERKFYSQNQAESPVYNPNDPTPPESPRFVVNTPFEPTTPEGPPPPFEPTTPEGSPPPFEPTTPEGPPPPFEPTTPEGPPPPFEPTTPEGTPPYQPVSPTIYPQAQPVQRGGAVSLVPVPVAYMPISNQLNVAQSQVVQPVSNKPMSEMQMGGDGEGVIATPLIKKPVVTSNSLLVLDNNEQKTEDASNSEGSSSGVKTISIN